MGVGATKRLSAVKWGLVGRIMWAWVLTLPVTGALGYGLVTLLHSFGV
jgi:PiT family inorganic phosphate transporter